MKVKIIKQRQSFYDDYDEYSAIQPVSLDWEVVDEATYEKICDAVDKANKMLRKRHDSARYIVVSYSEDTKTEVFKLASDFVKEQEKEEKRAEQERLKREQEKKDKALARKKKQLEKLKQELGEE